MTNLSAPITELRTYLLARYDQRFAMHPRLLELLVLEVFKDFGFTGHATAYQNDGGIDVILAGKDDVLIGVQVKRYRESISVEQIRSLAGALVLHGFTRGLFVTTSEYQRGCATTAQRFERRGLPVELIDATRLLHALHVTQREIDYEEADVMAIVAQAPLQLLAHTIGSCNGASALPLP